MEEVAYIMKKNRFKRFLSVFLAVMMLSGPMGAAAFSGSDAITFDTGAYTITKISNPERGSGEVDGFLPGGDRMNSYPWSMGQTEDYIFIGGNRNILLSAAMADTDTFSKFTPLLDLISQGELPPLDFSDNAARLFMIDKKTNEIKLAYQSELENGQPLDTGYRSANATFTPEGSDSESYFFGSTGRNCTRILRIDKGFDPDQGDKPTEVLRIDGRSTIRAMTVHENELVFGVSTPDRGPVVYASPNPTGAEAWTQIGSAEDFDNYAGTEDVLANGFICDMISFNGSIYVGISNSQPEQSDSGFMVYKATQIGIGQPGANEAGWKWEAIVADNTGRYVKGMGNMIAIMPTFCKYTAADGEEYVYVGTTSDPFTAIFDMLNGKFDMMYNVLQNPIELYRFDKNDNWELVLGTPDRHLYFNEKLGNLYAGFDNDPDKNLSCEQYAWALKEYNGKLFIGTFDAATLLKYVTIGVDNEKLNGMFQMDEAEKEQTISNVLDAVNALLAGTGNDSLGKAQTFLLRALLLSVINYFADKDVEQISNNLQSVMVTAGKKFDRVLDLISLLLPEQNARQLLEDSALGSLYKYVSIFNVVAADERGAGLYATEDGTNFETINLDGFHDEYNWGIRNFLPTENGLYIGMANPFYGGQLWLLTENEEPAGEQPQAPDSILSFFLRLVKNFFALMDKLFF